MVALGTQTGHQVHSAAYIPKQYIRCRIVLRLNPLRTWYSVVRQSCHRGILQSFASCLRTSGSHLSPLRTPPSSPKFRAGQGPNSLGSALRLPLLCILLLSLLGAGNAAATAKPRVVEPAASTVSAHTVERAIELICMAKHIAPLLHHAPVVLYYCCSALGRQILGCSRDGSIQTGLLRAHQIYSASPGSLAPCKNWRPRCHSLVH